MTFPVDPQAPAAPSSVLEALGRRRRAVRIEARVPRGALAYFVRSVVTLQGLELVDLNPAETDGPEVALVFADAGDEKAIRAELLRLGCPVLATRTVPA